MIITKKAIPRRTVLRGIGASLALPLLDDTMSASGLSLGAWSASLRGDCHGHWCVGAGWGKGAVAGGDEREWKGQCGVGKVRTV